MELCSEGAMQGLPTLGRLGSLVGPREGPSGSDRKKGVDLSWGEGAFITGHDY